MPTVALPRRRRVPASTGRSGPSAPPPMRVLHAITPSRMAGAETFLTRLLHHVAQGPVEHRCVVSRQSVIDEMRAKGVEVDYLAIRGKANLLAPLRLAAAARRMGAMVIDSHLSTASWWSGWLDWLGGLPTVGHVHGFTSRRWHGRQTHLITCSEAVKRDLVRKGIAPERITALHLPVDAGDLVQTRTRSEIRRDLGVDDRTPVVGTFAHLSQKKGHAELVEAAALVLREMPQTHFWCFGEGVLRETITRQVESLGIGDRFHLLGYRRDVPNLMRAVDVMALPSHREPFGLVYVEAGLCERPVIACQSGGAPEIVVEGETGLLVPAKDPPSLAQALLELLGDPTRAQRMGRQGHEICRQRFGWQRYIDALNEVYEQVASRSPVAVPALQVPAA